MEDIYHVPLKKLVEEFGLQVVYAASDYESSWRGILNILMPDGFRCWAMWR